MTRISKVSPPKPIPVEPSKGPSIQQIVYHMVVQATLSAVQANQARLQKANDELKKSEQGNS